MRHYASAIGVTGLSTPWDGVTASHAPVLDEIAWRWSFVLIDFLLSLRNYAESVDATDNWLLSRDSETLFDVARAILHLFGQRNVIYVYGSRGCVYPALAKTNSTMYANWFGSMPDEEAKCADKISWSYYTGLLRPESSCVLIVDM
jgi:hypothetical protein